MTAAPIIGVQAALLFPSIEAGDEHKLTVLYDKKFSSKVSESATSSSPSTQHSIVAKNETLSAPPATLLAPEQQSSSSAVAPVVFQDDSAPDSNLKNKPGKNGWPVILS